MFLTAFSYVNSYNLVVDSFMEYKAFEPLEHNRTLEA